MDRAGLTPKRVQVQALVLVPVRMLSHLPRNENRIGKISCIMSSFFINPRIHEIVRVTDFVKLPRES